MGLALPPLLAMGINHQNNGRGSSNNSGTGGSHHNNNNNPNGNTSSSDSEDDWGDGSWTVDCPCGVNYDDGEEMVECDECNVWVHTVCCHVPKSLPTYVCDKCKEKAKKREKEKESEVAQLLVELPGKTVSFDDGNGSRNGLMVTPGVVERQVHEQGVPGGEPGLFVGVPSVFSQQLWIATGYVPKVLQVPYVEFPKWLDDEHGHETISLFEPGPRRPPPLAAAASPKVKVETNIDTEMQHPPRLLLDVHRKDKQNSPQTGKKLEVLRHSKHAKHRFRRDDRNVVHGGNGNGKRFRDDVPPDNAGGTRKRMKVSPEAMKKGMAKNPKAMKKNAVQEYMDVDVKLCGKCQRPEDSDHECPRTLRHGSRKMDAEGKPDTQLRKYRHGGSSLNVSPETASTELPKQENPESEFETSVSKMIKRPPSDDDVEEKPKLSQLTIKTGTSLLKSDVPSPASINSGGTSSGSKLAADKSRNKLLLKPALMKSSSSSKMPGSTSAMRRSENKVGRVVTEASTSVKEAKHPSSKSAPTPSSQPKVKTPKSGQTTRTLKKHTGPQKSSSSHKEENPSASPTCKDKEMALLLHQQLNSSPRVPRASRARQSSQQAPSNMSNRRSGGNPPASQKDHRLRWRKRCGDDQAIRENSSKYEETPLLAAMNRKTASEDDTKSDDETASSRTDSPEPSDDGGDEDFLAEKGVDQTKHSSPISDADEKSDPDEVLRSKSNRVSFEDAVSPQRSLCKINGERFVESAQCQRSSMMDCATNRSQSGIPQGVFKSAVSQERCKASAEMEKPVLYESSGPSSLKHSKRNMNSQGNQAQTVVDNNHSSSSDDHMSNYSEDEEDGALKIIKVHDEETDLPKVNESY